MIEKILVITPPDDILLQGIRIAHIDLTEEQSNFVSKSLLDTEISNNIINYVWTLGNPLDWIFDKISKCDIIIFNADSDNQLLVGWLAGRPNSIWFGDLKDLHMVNDRAIYNVESITTLLEKVSKYYE